MAHRQPSDYLVHLLKHSWLALSESSNRAVARFGVDGKELAVLLTLSGEPGSQQDAARRLGIDRTTMVALLDALVAKELVRRRQDPSDRRRNLIELTDAGQAVVRGASLAAERAERDYLEPLSDAEITGLTAALKRLTER